MLFHGGGPPPTGVTTFTHGIIYYCARYESLPHAVATVRRTDRCRFVLPLPSSRRQPLQSSSSTCCGHQLLYHRPAIGDTYPPRNSRFIGSDRQFAEEHRRSALELDLSSFFIEHVVRAASPPGRLADEQLEFLACPHAGPI